MDKKSTDNNLISMRGVCNELGISYPTLKKITDSGQLPIIRLHGLPRIRRGTLNAFLDDMEKVGP